MLKCSCARNAHLHAIRCEYIHLFTEQNMFYNLQVRNLTEPVFSNNWSSKSLCNEVGYRFWNSSYANRLNGNVWSKNQSNDQWVLFRWFIFFLFQLCFEIVHSMHISLGVFKKKKVIFLRFVCCCASLCVLSACICLS